MLPFLQFPSPAFLSRPELPTRVKPRIGDDLLAGQEIRTSNISKLGPLSIPTSAPGGMPWADLPAELQVKMLDASTLVKICALAGRNVCTEELWSHVGDSMLHIPHTKPAEYSWKDWVLLWCRLAMTFDPKYLGAANSPWELLESMLDDGFAFFDDRTMVWMDTMVASYAEKVVAALPHLQWPKYVYNRFWVKMMLLAVDYDKPAVLEWIYTAHPLLLRDASPRRFWSSFFKQAMARYTDLNNSAHDEDATLETLKWIYNRDLEDEETALSLRIRRQDLERAALTARLSKAPKDKLLRWLRLEISQSMN